MSYTVLARRYRSRDFDELVGQEPIARTLRNAIQSDRTAHAYLFCGTRGVGKTSMARIFAKALNVTESLAEAEAVGAAILRGDDLDVIEIDGASNRGIQEARDLIAGAGLSPTRSPYKIYIIDEVHMLTREAFNALLKTMEEPPSHVKFILCTTDPQKVPATIQSRCQRFDFRTIATPAIAGQLRTIVAAEGIEVDEAVLQQVARLGHGSMRDALSLLDRLLAAGDGAITVALAEEILGLPDSALVSSIVDAIIDADVPAVLTAGAAILAGGASVEQALDMLSEHLRNLMLVAACGAETELVELGPEALEAAAVQAAHFDVAGLVYLISLCDAVGRNARGSAASRALFDAALVRMCLSERFADVSSLVARADGAPAERPAVRPAVAVPAAKKKSEVTAPPAPVVRERTAERPPAARPSARQATRPDARPDAPPDAPPAALPIAPPAEHPATIVEVAPAAPDAESGEALWVRVQQVASLSPADAAKVRTLEYRSLEGRTLLLAVSEGGASSARYLRTISDRIAELVERATKRRVQVRIEDPADTAPAEPAAPAPTSHDATADVRRSPLVQRAMEIFDASVIDVSADQPAPDRQGEP